MAKTKKQKQDEARERQVEYDRLSQTEKIARAANRRGKSQRELARLAAGKKGGAK